MFAFKIILFVSQHEEPDIFFWYKFIVRGCIEGGIKISSNPDKQTFFFN